MNMKKIVSAAVSWVLACNLTPIYAEDTSSAYKTAGVTVAGGSFQPENAKVSMNGFSFTTVDGVDYAVSNGSGNDNIYIDINDKYWFSEEGSSATFVAEYLDIGHCSFSLHYCNDTGGSLAYEKIFKMNDTGELKTVSICVDDFTAMNGCQNVDLRLRTCGWNTGCSGGKVYIKSVKIIDRREYSVDVRAENGEYGRIFDYGKDEMTFTALNDTGEKVTTEIDWRVRNNENRVISSGKIEAFKIESGETARQSFHTQTPDCGTYYLEYDVTSVGENGFSESYSRTLDFSVARKMQPGDKRNSVFGAVINGSVPYFSMESIEMAGSIGARSIRNGDNWDELETSVGEYNIRGFDQLEKIKDCGMTVVRTLSRSNPIYNGNMGVTRYSYDEKSLEAYGNAGAYLSTVEPIDYVEILNEYNHKGFNSGDQTPETYLLYLKAAYEAIKKVNPDCKVVAGNLAGYDIAFLQKLFSIGGFDYCDAISLHPYQGGNFDQGLYRSQMETMRALMKQHNVEKEIVLTEMGFSRAKESRDGMPETKRRVFAAALMLMSQGEGLADLVCWYDFVDDGTVETEREQQWGLVKYPTTLNRNTATDTFVTVAAMSNLVQDGEPVNVLKTDGDTTLAYNFKRSDGKNIVSAWTTQSSDILALNLGCETAKMYNMYGTYLGEITGNDGVFTLGLSDEIVYLEGNFPVFEESEPVVGLEASTLSAVRGDIVTLKSFDKLGRNIKLDVDYDSDIFTPVEEMSDNSTAEFKISENADEIYHMRVTVTDGDKLIYSGVVKIELNDKPIEATVEVVKASETDDTRWQAVAKLTNISNVNHYSGEIGIKEPERFAGAVRKFSDIAPGETITLKLNIPELVYKRPEDMVCEIKLNNGNVIEVAQKVDFTTAEYAKEKPTLDGVVSPGEWKGSVLCEDRAERVSLATTKAWNGKDDLSLEMRLLWDEEYLYVAASVRDDVYTMNGSVDKMWDGDCVQIGIVERIAGIENTSSAFTELALGEVGGEAKMYRYSHVGGNPQIEVTNFEGCIKRNGGVTVYEYAIPWSELIEEGHTPKEGTTYGYSVCVNDGDNGARHQWLNYNDGIGTSKDATKFGKLTLLNK